MEKEARAPEAKNVTRGRHEGKGRGRIIAEEAGMGERKERVCTNVLDRFKCG